MEVMTPHLLALSRLKVVLNRARVSAQGEGAKNASAKIDEALVIVNDDHDEIHAQAAKLVAKGDPPRVCPICGKQLGHEPKVGNQRCPFGHPIDPMSISDTLVLNYGGKKVGFCCPHCLADWKKLKDEDKQAKFKVAMAEK